MKEKSITTERAREATEKRLLDAIGMMITDNGFEKIGINAIASQSGVSKILIYRYFGSVEGLIAAYIQQHDFWLNFPLELPDRKQLPVFLKSMFQKQIEQLRNNPTLKRLYRWELSCNNKMIAQLRDQREEVGINLVEKICELTNRPQKEIAVMASLLSASITYLTMLEEFCPSYNGIAINDNSGWEQICAGIETLIDKYLKNE